MLQEIEIGPRLTITASGVPYYALTPDELTVLTGYRLIREQAGSMVVEFDRDRNVVRWDVKPNLGSPRTLGEMVKTRR